ncbi:MAG TPA: hypothetical protein VN671_08895 [Solirubrobacterales bacterium]|nr:hypothetical protein [Solirubrobacterales bacterium]
MSVARPGAARPGAPVAARNSRTVLFVAALAALCLVTALAATPARAQAQSQVCGGPRVPARAAASASSMRHAGPLGWIGARAGTALAEKGFLTGIEWIGKLAGHQSAGHVVIAELGEIRNHLNEVSSQLDRVQGQLGDISASVHNLSFETAMAPLCVIARQQRALFRDFYEPLIRNAYRLAEVLDSNNPKRAKIPDAGGFTLFERVEGMLSDFMRRSELRDDAGDFETLRHALVPDPENQNRSILSRYGLVLMSKRFLTRNDSNLIRHLFLELAQVRTIATWMSEEYWSGRGRDDLVRTRRRALVNDDTVENRQLPPMIPPGVLIDLGSGPRGSVLGRPMWYAPVDRDLGWLPGHMRAFDPATGTAFPIANREVEQVLGELNHPHRPRQGMDGLSNHWNAPTRIQLEALISNGCEVDPTDRSRFRDAVRCSNAVTAADGGTVAGYLNRLNEGNDRWRQLFCTPRPGGAPCPQGSGPDAASFRHLFIWTTNIHAETVDCGSQESGRSTTFIRESWRTYTGFRTTTSGHVWHAIPQLTARPRPAWRTNRQHSNNVCGAFIARLFGEVPRGNLLLKGVLLATRQVDLGDLNPHNRIDFMGQWRPAT